MYKFIHDWGTSFIPILVGCVLSKLFFSTSTSALWGAVLLIGGANGIFYFYKHRYDILK